jgi:hypothetical protein
VVMIQTCWWGSTRTCLPASASQSSTCTGELRRFAVSGCG